jgi:hypothetical protein
VFRTRFRTGRSALPRKVAGIALAAVGIALLADAIPLAVWLCLLGAGLIFAGWKLFTG